MQNPAFIKKDRVLFFCGAIIRGTMAELSLEKVFSLLGTQHIKGSDKELKTLCIRIGELVELNGEDWVQKSRQTLLDEWEYIVSQGIIR